MCVLSFVEKRKMDMIVSKTLNLSFNETTCVNAIDLMPEGIKQFRIEELNFVDDSIEASFILVIQTWDKNLNFEEDLLTISESDCMIPMKTFDLMQEEVHLEFVPRKKANLQSAIDLNIQFSVIDK